MPNTETEIKLSVLLTVVSGVEAVRRCLTVLTTQIDFFDSEIIVPFDEWSAAVGDLATEFPEVSFHFVEDLGLAKCAGISAHEHRLYDRRRAVGLRLSRGKIVAMTEDHAIPAADWCQSILKAHEQSYKVIGGAIENAVDRPLNWAWYYCDFGRYGRPLKNVEAEYVSDINVAYKRDALESVRDVWREAYHETTVHRALQNRGTKLYLDERMVVFQNRPPLLIKNIWRERLDWGRIFAETRAREMSFTRRLIYAAGAIFLPPLLFVRVLKNMRRQKRSARQMWNATPYLLFLLIGWSAGESTGYLFGEPTMKTDDLKIAAHDGIAADSYRK
jgi:hypothetical protein